MPFWEPYQPLTAYYTKLYHELFEKPQNVIILKDSVKTEATVSLPNKLIYGAKPMERTVTTNFKTNYVADEQMFYGQQRESGGLTGEKVLRTYYILNDNQPREIEEVISERLPVDKTIFIGVKPEIKTVWEQGDNGSVRQLQTVTSYHLDEHGYVRSDRQVSILETKLASEVVTSIKADVFYQYDSSQTVDSLSQIDGKDGQTLVQTSWSIENGEQKQL